MKKLNIEDLRIISKKNIEKNNIKIQKFAKYLLKRDEKQTKRIILKLNKLIYRNAKNGEFTMWHNFGCRLTNEQLNLIKIHFEEQGYLVIIHEHPFIAPSIYIKWIEKENKGE